jgi:putative phosphoesterase
MKLGIISDTHGHLSPRVHELFVGVDAIIHAGDFGKDDIFIELETIAPVTAVRGNMDRFGKIALHDDVLARSFDGIRFFIVHDIGSPYSIRPRLLSSIEHYAPHVVIFGHTHKPFSSTVNGMLFFNPGSATQARGGHKKSVGIIEIQDSRPVGHILEIDN